MKKAWIAIIVVLILVAGGALMIAGKKTTEEKKVDTTTPQAMTQSSSGDASLIPTENIYHVRVDSAKGEYLTDFADKALYIFDKDTEGVSNCYDTCAQKWPVYTSGATAQKVLPVNVTVITRKDGTKQFAWKGMPLYYFASDTKAGDITGDGVGGVWHLAKQ